jgi:glycosyltransferase involved in cell wall biosynthesis
VGRAYGGLDKYDAGDCDLVMFGGNKRDSLDPRGADFRARELDGFLQAPGSERTSTKNASHQALFLAPIMPSNRGNGLAMRTGFLLDTYAKSFEIDLAVIPLAGAATEITPFVKTRVRRAVILNAAPNTHFTLIRSIIDRDARLSAFRNYAQPSLTSRLGVDLERKLLDFANSGAYELVHVSRLYLASLAAEWMRMEKPRPQLVLDCDDWDVGAYRSFAQLHRKWGHENSAKWADAEADAFRSHATQWLHRFDLLLAASAGEARAIDAYGGAHHSAVVPNVVRANETTTSPRRLGLKRRDIIFVGNMEYLPNIDAARWFVSRVWPILRSAVPFPVRFVIVGPASSHEVKKLARRSGVVVAGWVDNVAKLYRQAALAVIPVRAGGGTRIKLLESARYGVPIVSTRFGAAGTNLRSGQDFLLADNEADFAVSCATLLMDDKLASSLAGRAQRKVRRDYDAKRAAARLLAIINSRIN